jgi:hypothetical protein
MDMIIDAINIITAIIAIASIIVKITPTQKDDAFMAKLKPYIDLLALTPKDAKK